MPGAQLRIQVTSRSCPRADYPGKAGQCVVDFACHHRHNPALLAFAPGGRRVQPEFARSCVTGFGLEECVSG